MVTEAQRLGLAKGRAKLAEMRKNGTLKRKKGTGVKKDVKKVVKKVGKVTKKVGKAVKNIKPSTALSGLSGLSTAAGVLQPELLPFTAPLSAVSGVASKVAKKFGSGILLTGQPATPRVRPPSGKGKRKVSQATLDALARGRAKRMANLKAKKSGKVSGESGGARTLTVGRKRKPGRPKCACPKVKGKCRRCGKR